MTGRREFLVQTALTTGGLMLFGGFKSALTAATNTPCRIEILLGEELDTKAEELFVPYFLHRRFNMTATASRQSSGD